MSLGLPVSRLVNATVNLSPLAAQFANLNNLLILGDSDVIDTGIRLRAYNDIGPVATDFGTTAPEYLAALLYFQQVPKPSQLLIGRWAQAATNGRLICGTLSAAQQLLSAFTGFTAGQFKIQIDAVGAPVNVTCATLAGASTLAGVATIISAALVTASVAATCIYDAVYSRFVFKSNSTGVASKVLPLTSGTANDMLAALNGSLVLGATEVDGLAPETALQAVTALDANATSWYGLTVASTHVVDADHQAIAPYIEASGNPHLYGVSTTAAGVLTAGGTSDIAYILSNLGYKRTFVVWSSSSLYAAASMFGRFLTTDFAMNNSTITLMYKQFPGITAESLQASQADTLIAKRANFFAKYNNNTAIVQNGVCCGAAYIDEMYGLDWLANAIQTNCFNILYTSLTKIPQTDAGNHVLATAIEAACVAGVNNGLLAPGTWTTTGFGQIKQNDYLDKGFYVYAPPVANQADADRQARKSVAFQVAAKLAGAVHTANIAINVVR